MNVSTMKELKGKLNSLNAELFDDVAFREFYKFMFDYAKGEGSSGINAEYGGIWGESMEEDNLWPKNNPMFRETMTEYFLKMLNLARSLNRVNALALGQNSDFFDSFFEDNNFPSIVRLNYYPPTGSDKLVLGVNPHQDGGCLTILKIDDEVSGLQVYKGITSEFQVESSDWVTVDPVPGLGLSGWVRWWVGFGCQMIFPSLSLHPLPSWSSFQTYGFRCSGSERWNDVGSLVKYEIQGSPSSGCSQ
eukprot:TRINITY_DN6623_c0_g1_i18.p1 TRINITY_DN6623_c0_g1~~TRINITY_DN6623_c0_g1_i18.p1  ORF type:complete len:247 (-),score=63.17 TRINITY_DN6623_c0_g1_i18:450-1190(-)